MQAPLTCQLYLTTTGTPSCGKSILMIRQVFETSENIYALNVLNDFFNLYELQYALQDTEQIFYYALHRKFYKKASPYHLVFFGQCLQKLISACLVLSKENYTGNNFEVPPTKTGMPDLTLTGDYIPDGETLSWFYLPRHLSIAQYLQPMTALEQLKKYKNEGEWKNAINELVEYALSAASINNREASGNVMKLRKILLEVIEASHLIVVRNNK